MSAPAPNGDPSDRVEPLRSPPRAVISPTRKVVVRSSGRRLRSVDDGDSPVPSGAAPNGDDNPGGSGPAPATATAVASPDANTHVRAALAAARSKHARRPRATSAPTSRDPRDGQREIPLLGGGGGSSAAATDIPLLGGTSAAVTATTATATGQHDSDGGGAGDGDAIPFHPADRRRHSRSAERVRRLSEGEPPPVGWGIRSAIMSPGLRDSDSDSDDDDDGGGGGEEDDDLPDLVSPRSLSAAAGGGGPMSRRMSMDSVPEYAGAHTAPAPAEPDPQPSVPPTVPADAAGAAAVADAGSADALPDAHGGEAKGQGADPLSPTGYLMVDPGTTGDAAAESHATQNAGLYPGERYLPTSAAAGGPAALTALVSKPIPPSTLALTVLNRVLESKVLFKDRFPIFVLSLEGEYDSATKRCPSEPSPVLFAKRRRKKNGKYAYDIATTMEGLHAGVLVGKVNTSFTKRSYCVFDGGSKPRKGGGPPREGERRELAAVRMTANSYRKGGPRELVAECADPASGAAVHFVNRIPRWDDALKQHTLKFYNRAKASSVKNFLLVQDGAQYRDLPHVLLHGKRSQHAFSLDVRHPLTLVQAFGIALCSFENSVLENAF